MRRGYWFFLPACSVLFAALVPCAAEQVATPASSASEPVERRVVAPAQSTAAREQVWILDVDGTEVFVYEVGSWELLRVIETGANPHGIAATADGKRVFISVERLRDLRGRLVWINAETLEIEGGVDVGREPHEIECTPDGKFVYVPTLDDWEVVDVASRRVVERIRVRGRPHNTTIHPDGDRMFLSPLAPAREVTVVSLPDHRVIDVVPFGAAPRPCAVSGDGSYLFQNVDGLLGYAVADLSSGVVKRYESGLAPSLAGVQTRFHGLAIHEQRREVWTANLQHRTVHVHSLDDHRQTHRITTRFGPYWISMSHDERFVFVSTPRSLGGPRLACKVLLAVFVLALALFLFVGRVSARPERARRIALVAAGIVGLSGISTYAFIKTAKGVVQVYDAETKAHVIDLAAGRVPKRTLSVTPE